MTSGRAIERLPEESWASSTGTRASMLGNRSRDTGPELLLRRALHARGVRYRVNRPVPGLPRRTMDISWTGRKLAVFVDGCFWHGCPQHGSSPRTNSDYWAPKLARNAQRDVQTTAALQAAGWTVLRIWEHEDLDSAVAKVLAALASATRTAPESSGIRNSGP